MDRPIVPDISERLYGQLFPYAHDDEQNGWMLLLFLGAMGVMYQLVDSLASDGPNGEPGWSALMDIDRIPDEGLPWLAQMVGVVIPPGLSPADQRQQIRETGGWKRGTVGALIGAAKPFLTGPKTVYVQERSGGNARHITVITYTNQTPDSAAVLRALMSQKAATLTLFYSVVPGQTYAQLRANNANYAAVRTKYATYTGVRNDQPGV